MAIEMHGRGEMGGKEGRKNVQAHSGATRDVRKGYSLGRVNGRDNATTSPPEHRKGEDTRGRECVKVDENGRGAQDGYWLLIFAFLSFCPFYSFPVVFTTSTSQRPKESDCLSGPSEVKRLDRTSS